MLIRSQDKTRLVNMDVIDAITIDYGNNYYIESWRGEVSTYLGEYKTKEKAVKVLDMIQETCVANKGYYLSGSKSRTSFVFQVPQDSEVEL